MPIRIFNSLTKKKEEFKPQNGNTVKMYCCGVTVYDKCHIGHARSLYIFDMIRQYLNCRGYDVYFVRNITDVDDKIIKKAKELNLSSEELARNNIESYYDDLKNLAIHKADCEPRATENIEAMVEYIKELITKGYAYEVDGNVYYEVKKFKEYGRLSGQSSEHMQDAVRIEADPNKKDPLDFALWKKSAEDEPGWDSPWSYGRPGWHIECTCMSMKHLNTYTLDIHAGGRDLIFPHHENEIAQSEAITNVPFARYWIHMGLLTIRAQKMAKSLGNFITIEDAVNKYSADVLKMFYISSHYASPIDFTEEKMVEAKKALDRFEVLFWKADNLLQGKSAELHTVEYIESYKEKFYAAMDDDFNSSKALGYLFEWINETNKFIDQNKEDPEYFSTILTSVTQLKEILKDIFLISTASAEEELNSEDQELLDQRRQARLSKDFKKSDELRDLLKERGIIVEDSKDGQTWRKL